MAGDPAPGRASGVGELRRSALSAQSRQLIALMSEVGFGTIENLRVCCGEPLFDPPPKIQRQIKFGGSGNGFLHCCNRGDFALKAEHVELLQLLRRIGTGVVSVLEIRNSLPFRAHLVDEALGQEAPP